MHRTSEIGNTIIDGIILLFKVSLVICCLLTFAIGQIIGGVGCVIAMLVYYRSMQKESYDLLKYLGVFIFILAIAQSLKLLPLPISMIELFTGFILGVILFFVLQLIANILIKIVSGADHAIRKLL